MERFTGIFHFEIKYKNALQTLYEEDIGRVEMYIIK